MPTPAKSYYRIREVAAMLDLPAYTLRFWEDEFPMLNPDRTPYGQRRYTPEQVEMARRIKELLYDRGMKIDAAIKVLNATYRSSPPRRAFSCNSSADALRLLGDVTHSLTDAFAFAKIEAVTEWIKRASTPHAGNNNSPNAI